jgi:hypothetical protein
MYVVSLTEGSRRPHSWTSSRLLFAHVSSLSSKIYQWNEDGLERYYTLLQCVLTRLQSLSPLIFVTNEKRFISVLRYLVLEMTLHLVRTGVSGGQWSLKTAKKQKPRRLTVSLEKTSWWFRKQVNFYQTHSEGSWVVPLLSGKATLSCCLPYTIDEWWSSTCPL